MTTTKDLTTLIKITDTDRIVEHPFTMAYARRRFAATIGSTVEFVELSEADPHLKRAVLDEAFRLAFRVRLMQRLMVAPMPREHILWKYNDVPGAVIIAELLAGGHIEACVVAGKLGYRIKPDTADMLADAMNN